MCLAGDKKNPSALSSHIIQDNVVDWEGGLAAGERLKFEKINLELEQINLIECVLSYKMQSDSVVFSHYLNPHRLQGIVCYYVI